MMILLICYWNINSKLNFQFWILFNIKDTGGSTPLFLFDCYKDFLSIAKFITILKDQSHSTISINSKNCNNNKKDVDVIYRGSTYNSKINEEP